MRDITCSRDLLRPRGELPRQRRGRREVWKRLREPQGTRESLRETPRGVAAISMFDCDARIGEMPDPRFCTAVSCQRTPEMFQTQSG